METYSEISREDEKMELPPGFRFHPTDEELITHYLSKKVINNNFNPIAIGVVDFNKVEPWDLPRKAKMGVKEWYFFCVKDRKYPTGLRTNRATETGYWKATGKDKEIYRDKSLIGMKKTLVFYTGRAPKGGKTNWVMHEYRQEGKYFKVNQSKTTKEWVLSRVVNKGSSGKNMDHSGFVSLDELHPRSLPPLMDSSYPCISVTKEPDITNPPHVTCFSNHPLVVEDQNVTRARIKTTLEDHVDMISDTNFTSPSSASHLGSKLSIENSIMEQSIADFQYIDSIFMQDQSILRHILEGKGCNNMKEELSQQTGLCVGDMNIGMSPASNLEQMTHSHVGSGPIDLDCLWDY